jgi:hypothetical protein
LVACRKRADISGKKRLARGHNSVTAAGLSGLNPGGKRRKWELLPEAFAMGAAGTAALIANATSFGLLWAYRGGMPPLRK